MVSNLRFYKIVENEVVILWGSGKTIPPNSIEITETEYNQLMEDFEERSQLEPEPTPSEFDLGFESGYEQALLDLMELEMDGEE